MVSVYSPSWPQKNLSACLHLQSAGAVSVHPQTVGEHKRTKTSIAEWRQWEEQHHRGHKMEKDGPRVLEVATEDRRLLRFRHDESEIAIGQQADTQWT